MYMGQRKRVERRGDGLYIYPSLRRFGVLGLGALAFVALVASYGPKRGTLAFVALDVPLFGLIFLWVVYRLIARGPLLVVDAEGIRDNSGLLSAGFLRWSEIERVYISGMAGRRYLCIVPVDPAAFLRHRVPPKQVLMRVSVALAGVPVNIMQNTLPLPLEDVVAAMRVYGLPASADEGA